MKIVEIKTSKYDERDLKAVAYFEGKEVDNHIHSNEAWLLQDWGFTDNQEQINWHGKKLLEIVGEPFTLVYKNKHKHYD